ncbi:hypothetical protein [Prosthecobacter sp.]|uniref:hypothetical protein n=1 Tax=Prosthecobacter sp. TaxID=1965333 RepID=UPI0037833B78
MTRIQSAKKWDQYYRKGYYSTHEYFCGLIHCVKFQEPSEVLLVLNDDELEKFKSVVAEFNEVNDFSELVSIGDPPEFGRSEIDKLAEILNLRSSP